MARSLALIAVLIAAIVAGCGNAPGGLGDGTAGPTGPTGTTGVPPQATVVECLSQAGYRITPSATDLSAETPGGTAFTIAFFPSPDEAGAAAVAAGATATAVGNAVVTASPTALTPDELATIRGCLGAS